MNTTTRFIRNWSCLALALVLLTTAAQSAQYTAVASGNWSAAATWGQAPPSPNITNNQIIIPLGITVTMDVDVTVNGATASLGVLGMLTGATTTTLTITQGGVAGTGTINVGTLTMAAGALTTYAGNLTVEYLNTASTGVQLKAQTTVNKGLNLTGGVLTVASGGLLALAENSTITISGGTMAVSGGNLTLTNTYNVRYITAAATTGLELSGTGLANITIDVPAGVNVSLGSSLSLTPATNLNLNSGNLRLNGKDLTVNGGLTAVAGTSVIATSASSLAINSVAGTVGVLNFTGTANQLQNLSIGVGLNATAQIAGTLEVLGTVQLISGSLRFDGANLTLNGAVSGAGSLSGNAQSNLTINTAGGISTGIRFVAGGQALKNFTINVGTNAVVRLLSNLSVSGLMSLTGGSNLNISDIALTLNGDVAGTGSFIITGNSGLTVNTPNGLSSNLSFSGNTIGTLAINTDSGKTVGLASDLIVWQSLNMQRGTLVLNGNDLTINGDIVAQTAGDIRSTSASDISIVSLTGGTAGTLKFSGTANAVKNLSISILPAATTGISGTLTIENSLNLQSGTLNIGGATLTLNGNVTGSGSLGTNATSSLVINTAGGIPVGINLVDAAGGTLREIKNLTINVGTNNTVKLLGDLSILGATTLTSGNLDISNFDISLGGTLTGTGAFIVNGSTGLMINTLGGLSTPLNLSGSSIGEFGVNVGTGGSVKLGSDMTVAKTLRLNGGTLILNGNDLTISGNIVGTATGTVLSTEASNVSIISSSSTTGVLRFSDTSAVGTLTVDVGGTNSARIAGDIDVMTSLVLTSGALVLDDVDLTLNGILIGSGALSSTATSDLTINTPGGLSTPLRFAANGKTINNLTINVGAANGVELGSDVIVAGTLDLGGGTLSISEFDLTLGGPLTGSGSIGIEDKSSLIINTPGGFTTPLTFVGTTLGYLTVNAGAGGSVSLASDIDVSSRLNLKSGTLVLADNDLTISGVIDGTGSGALSSTNTSNITLSTLLSSTGKLMFDATANAVNNLTVSAAPEGAASIGSDIMVDGTLTLTSGRLNIGDNTLTIGAGGSVTGGSSTSYIQTSMGGALSLGLNAGASTATTFPVGTATAYLPASVTLAAGSSSGNVNVGVYEGVYAQGTTGSLISASESTINGTWDVSSDIASNLKMNLEVAWAAQSEVNNFDRTQAYISHYTSGAWDASAKGAATVRGDGMFSLTRNDITSLSPFAVFDGSTTGVEDDILASNVNVYPSPASDVIIIENITAGNTAMTVDIVDAQGRLVATSNITGSHQSINVSALSSGIYFIRLHNASASATKSFVKM